MWLAESGEALEREEVDSTGGVAGLFSGGCTPFAWWWIDQGSAGLAVPETDVEDDMLHGRF